MEKHMQIYHHNPYTQDYIGTTTADESPLEPGVYLIPAHATETAPPEFNAETHTCKFIDDAWTVAAIPPPEPEPTPEEIEHQTIASLTAAVQQHLDTTAQQRNYDGILSLCTYATSTNAKFKAEGQAGVQWRDAVWAACYAIMAGVKAGDRAIPTAEELIAAMPVMTWPEP